MIESVYCICLDKRKGLWPALEKQVNEIIGLPLNKFIVGKGEDSTLEYDFIDKPFSNDMWRYCRYGTEQTISAHANCFLAHKEIIKRAKADGLKNILLLEDDAHLLTDRWHDLGSFVEEFIEYGDASILYFGWWLKKTPNDSEDQNDTERLWREEKQFAIKRVPTPPNVAHNICGFHGVVIFEKMYDFLLNAQYGPMDSYVGSHINDLDAFMTMPKMIHVSSQFSYGENSYVKRNVLK